MDVLMMICVIRSGNMENNVFNFASSPGMALSILHTKVQTQVIMKKRSAEVISSVGKTQKRAVIPFDKFESVHIFLHLSAQYVFYSALAVISGLILKHWIFYLFAAALLLRGINRRIVIRWEGEKEITVYSASLAAAKTFAEKLRKMAAAPPEGDKVGA